MIWGWDNARALIGLAVIVFIAWCVSEARGKVHWRVVIGAVTMQFLMAICLFGLPKLFGADSVFEGGGQQSNHRDASGSNPCRDRVRFWLCG